MAEPTKAKTVKVRVVSKQPVNEFGHHVQGEVFETTPDRVKAIGPDVVEVPADTPLSESKP